MCSNQLIGHACFQESSGGELMQWKSKLFEENLNLWLDFLIWLLRVINFPQYFEETDNPGVGSIEDLEVWLGRFFQDSAHKENNVLLLVHVAFHEQLFEVNLTVVDRPVTG